MPQGTNLGSLGTAFVDFAVNLTTLKRGLDSAEGAANRSTDRISRDIRSIADSARFAGQSIKALGGFFLSAQFTGAVGKALDLAESIGDISARANVSTGFLQEIGFAAQRFGATTRDVNDSVTRLNRRVGLFISTGGGPGAAAFDRLGISADIAAGRLSGTEDIFNAIVTQLQKVTDESERTALASGVFGEDAGPKLAVLLGQGSEAIEGFREEARRAGVVLSDDVIQSASSANVTIRELSSTLSTTFVTAIAQAAPQIEAIANQLADTLPVLLDWLDAFTRIVNPNAGRTGIESRIREITLMLSDPIAFGDLSDAARNELENERAGLYDVIFGQDIVDAARDAGRESGEAFSSGFEGELGERGGEGGAIEPPSTSAPSIFSGSPSLKPSNEIPSLFEQIRQGIQDTLPDLEEFSATTEDAFAEFVLGSGRAKDVFRNFAQSVIADIARVIARKLVLQAVSSIFGVGGGALGGVFGGGRRNGGPVNPNQSFLVGESGAELFVPDVPGTILPNGFGGGGGGQAQSTVVNTFNINGSVMDDVDALRGIVERANRDLGRNVITIVNEGTRNGSLR